MSKSVSFTNSFNAMTVFSTCRCKQQFLTFSGVLDPLEHLGFPRGQRCGWGHFLGEDVLTPAPWVISTLKSRQGEAAKGSGGNSEGQEVTKGKLELQHSG